jgi:hypothetical protein
MTGRPPLPARERMLRAAVRLISTQGVTSTGLREIVAASDAPRGSLRIVGITGGSAFALDATTVAALRGPPQTSPLFEEAGQSAANDG